ncbi:DUF86 domain-containing protein [Halalkalibacter hemicellulosilyticus]|uniref:DUF86 domain-containing protein n=1 Tax=Halalkalibacter hemicellulosilyticusJCM 9152 TaxID=1236971 RepID=W4QE14_9BACI|nr:DUF86 domain-containing protein [Halalkalibacter hemicellulosilyticus]GAE30300.1 hypothetical protein JCM9152_1704 [Halalkalibacter hemicellulosilyticusJCM 9152]
MYFVDRNQIEVALTYMETSIEHFETLTNIEESFTDQLALERIAMVVIESIIDVGNSMIDGFIMRDPGSYEDIVDILEDEKVIDHKQANDLKKIVSKRKALVQQFQKIDHQSLKELMNEHKDALLSFPTQVRRYLVQELGPVSAFIPK